MDRLHNDEQATNANAALLEWGSIILFITLAVSLATAFSTSPTTVPPLNQTQPTHANLQPIPHLTKSTVPSQTIQKTPAQHHILPADTSELSIDSQRKILTILTGE